MSLLDVGFEHFKDTPWPVYPLVFIWPVVILGAQVSVNSDECMPVCLCASSVYALAHMCVHILMSVC